MEQKEFVKEYNAEMKFQIGKGSFLWKIENFLLMSQTRDGDLINSPTMTFFFDNLKYKNYNFHLALYTGIKKDEKEGDIGLFFHNDNYFSARVQVNLQLIDAKGTIHKSLTLDKTYGIRGSWGWDCFKERKYLSEHEDLLLPDGTLTLKCDLNVIEEELVVLPVNLKEKLKTDQFKNDFEKMLLDNLFTDFEVISEGEIFHCHKAVLATRSEVFHAMLSTRGGLESTKNQLIIKDFGPMAVSKMIKYLYCGQLSDEEASCTELLLLADKYNIPDLIEDCEIALIKSLKLENVAKIISVAHRINSTILLKRSAQFVARNYVKVRKTLEWKKLLKENGEALDSVFEECLGNDAE